MRPQEFSLRRIFLWLLNRVRVTPITHIAEKGTLLCAGKVLCGDYREFEGVGATFETASCYGCRRKVIDERMGRPEG